MHKCVFLDIDGTLVPAGYRLPPDSAMDAIRTARAAGHRVFLCTGRIPVMLQPVLELGFDGAVACAGGHVSCGDTVLYDHPMSRDLKEHTLALLHRAGMACVLEARSGAFGSSRALSLLSGDENPDREMARRQKALIENLHFLPMDGYDDSPVYKILYVGADSPALAEAERQLEQDFFLCRQVAFGNDGMVHGELINRAFDKGSGVRRICAFHGTAPEDAIGFGDSMNDLSMLQTVGTSVCMESGDPALRAVSTLTCPPPEQDGIAVAFRQLGLI